MKEHIAFEEMAKKCQDIPLINKVNVKNMENRIEELNKKSKEFGQ